jgi:hypothetical protein
VGGESDERFSQLQLPSVIDDECIAGNSVNLFLALGAL